MLHWSHILTTIKELHPTLSPPSVFLTQVVFSSCELGVFDALLGAGRPLSAEEISQAIGASLDGTERLLAACTGLQLLNAHRDDRQGQQHHPPPCTPVSLVSSAPAVMLSQSSPPPPVPPPVFSALQ